MNATKRIPYNEKENAYLKEFYSCMDRKTIISDLNRSWDSIKWNAKKLGLNRPNIRDAKLKKLLDNSIENAYWWGFIMSDGYLSDKGELIICLSTHDKSHLIKLAEHIEYPVNIQDDLKFYMSRFSVMDRINGLKLKNALQIGTKKTYNPPSDSSFLKTPEERLAFFIGFVDGDGSLTYDKKGIFKSIRIVIHGNWYDWWVDFCNQLKPNYPDLAFNVNNTNARGNTSIYIGKKQTREFLINFIKEHKLTTLERKWKINTH
jgi:hypothetical protein